MNVSFADLATVGCFFVSIGWLEPLLQLEAPFYFVNFGDNMVG